MHVASKPPTREFISFPSFLFPLVPSAVTIGQKEVVVILGVNIGELYYEHRGNSTPIMSNIFFYISYTPCCKKLL